jgi:CheY-like chemotaxis protein
MNKPDHRAQILIVEDEAIVSLDIKRTLTNAGYEVCHVAASAEDALRSMESALPDLVLMDIHIKGKTDGVETAEKIRQKFQVPVIFVTAHADNATLERAKSAQPFGYIVKPISKLSLTSTVEIALHKNEIDKRLTEHRAWMATVLGGIPDAVIVTDIHGKVEFANPAAERLLGRRQSSLVLRDVVSLVPLSSPEVTELTSEALQNAIVSGSFELPRETSLLVPGTTERIPIEGQVAISYVGHRTAGAIFTLRDASKREQEDMQIRQQQKMLALGELATDISQSFHGLFEVISSSNSRLKHYVESSPRAKEGNILHEMESVQRASKTGMLMAGQLAKLGDHHSLPSQSVSANEVISATVPVFEKLGGPSLELEVDLCAEPTFVFCHANHLEQVLLNVFVNCRELLGGSGGVRLASQIAIGARDQVQIKFELTSEMPLSLSFAKENVDFDLSVASAIITAAEGGLRVERQSENKGEVEILLPRRRASIQMEPKFADARGVVMIVGATLPVARAVEQQLEASHYGAIDCANVAEALFVAQFYDGEIVAVIADADGVSHHNRQKIKKAFLDRNRTTKFICLTLELEPSDPIWHSVLKPLQTRDIANTLASLLLEEDLTIHAAHN